MNSDIDATRRSFLKTGALLAVPLAAAAPAAVLAEPRLTKIEDEAAIRALHQTWLRQVNTGGCEAAAHLFADPKAAQFDRAVRAIAADHAGDPDAIEIAAEGNSAAGRFHYIVEAETTVAPDCTLAQMAHAQGGGTIRRTERRLLNGEYVKGSGGWAIAKLEFAGAESL